LYGETDGTETKVEFLELGQRRYREIIVDLPSSEPQAVLEHLLNLTTTRRGKNDHFRLKLTRTRPENKTSPALLAKVLTDSFYFPWKYCRPTMPEQPRPSYGGNTVSGRAFLP
jgi:hypothetical protein